MSREKIMAIVAKLIVCTTLCEKGTIMVFAGIKSESDRKDLVAFLKSKSPE